MHGILEYAIHSIARRAYLKSNSKSVYIPKRPSFHTSLRYSYLSVGAIVRVAELWWFVRSRGRLYRRS